jgi:hypothetical protein
VVKREQKRKAAYKLCSDKIISMLLERGQLTLTYDHKVMISEIDRTNGDGIIMDNMYWIITKMLKQGLIQKNGNVINLISKGEKRFKRTTKIDREKWKRELSDIVCTWIAKT